MPGMLPGSNRNIKDLRLKLGRIAKAERGGGGRGHLVHHVLAGGQQRLHLAGRGIQGLWEGPVPAEPP